MNTYTNPTKLTGSSCSCAGSSKPCKCGGAGGCDCGGACQVDTMVRPRFFAGQLLTEDDLQSLEDYVLAKNRLHNRHLFGAGVVCGLEVLCDPCGGGHVAVQPGYALDCCGNDIVLDCKLSLDINAMVRDLRRDQLGGYDCGDPCSVQQQNLAKPTKPGQPVEPPPREYCLYVRYCEQESDPVSPYAVDEPCGGQTCEPSRIREGIRFELRCPQPASPGPELITAILHCFQDVIGIEAMSVDALTLNSLQRQITLAGQTLEKSSYEDLRRRLLDLIDRSPHLVNCKLRDRVLAVPPPVTVQKPGAIPVTELNAPKALIDIFLELLKECVCMAFNPPCAPCDDTGVLLACLKVQHCDVIEICNMTRHFVITPTALRYWLSFGEWERLVAAWCCGEPKTLGIDRSSAGDFGQAAQINMQAAAEGGTSPGTDTDQPLPERDPALQIQAILVAIAGMQPDNSPNAARFARAADAMGALGGIKRRPVPGEDEVSPAELEAIDASIAKVVTDRIDPQSAQIKGALEQVTSLQKQVDALTEKIGAMQSPRAARPQRAPRPPQERKPE